MPPYFFYIYIMTREEIQQILDLALEYYKLEIFGTDKVSEPPTEERIDWILERIKKTKPLELNEIAEKCYKKNIVLENTAMSNPLNGDFKKEQNGRNSINTLHSQIDL